jgi:hypothetical protein
MGTKLTPGAFDCYADAKPDEPMFILLGRDPMAGILVRLWARLRDDAGEDPAKVEEAVRCAAEMERYAIGLGKHAKVVAAIEGLQRMAMPESFR